MSVVFRESSERALMSRLDIGLISLRDRACLRLLYRAGVATAEQLTAHHFVAERVGSFRSVGEPAALRAGDPATAPDCGSKISIDSDPLRNAK